MSAYMCDISLISYFTSKNLKRITVAVAFYMIFSCDVIYKKKREFYARETKKQFFSFLIGFYFKVDRYFGKSNEPLTDVFLASKMCT